MTSALDVQHSCNEVSTIVKWKVENFVTQLPKEKKTTLASPPFYLYKNRLSFYLYFKSVDNNDYCGLTLFYSNLDNENEVELKWKGWIENEDGKKIGDQRELNHKFDEKNSCSGNYKLVKHSELYPPESNFIKNDVVFMCCEISQNKSQEWFKSIQLNDIQLLKSYYKNAQDNCVKKVKGKLAKSEKSGKLIINMKNKTFKIKKTLLSLQSPVFKKMLENKNLNETKIDDFEPEIFEAFNEYLHLEYITPENLKYARGLLELAGKYNVVKLKDECTQILTKNLNKDNVIMLLKPCFMHDFPKLKEHVLNYVTSSESDASFKDIMKTKEWNKFALENESIAGKIIDAVFARIQQSNGTSGAGPSTSNSGS